jgi:GxxExxY protein
MEVHRRVGRGFLEAVYQDALAVEFAANNIPFRREAELPVLYKGHRLPTGYRADFICFETLVVEIKALDRLTTNEEAQVLNYLKATGHEIGLLLNFGGPSLQYRRLILSKSV